MSDAEYTAIQAKPLRELRGLPFWQVIRFIERCSPLQRKMIVQALAA